MKDRGSAIGIMLFSYENGSIDFMGSHPLYRKKGGSEGHAGQGYEGAA